MILYRRSFLAVLLLAILATLPAAADDHPLLCEGAIQGADFVEIVNPTHDSWLLDHYYLSDHKQYFRLPAAHGGSTPKPEYTGGDFSVRFPPGTLLGPGEVVVVAFGPAAFRAAYGGREPDFEIRRPGDPDDPAVADMLEAYPGSIAASPGFTSSGEYVVLFSWDGGGDLILDVDMVRLGAVPDTKPNNDVPEKSGEAVDGPDIGGATTRYPFEAMSMDTPPSDPQAGASTKRLLLEDGSEIGGGCGMTGHDETSERIARTWDGEFGYGPADPGCCLAAGLDCYYEDVAATDPATLRGDLNERIAGHKRFGWGNRLWEILELADADPYEDDGDDEVDFILDIYQNSPLPRGTPRSYQREHTWPKSLGFPETTKAPHTDCHALFLAYEVHNNTRSNRAYGNCDPAKPGHWCQELVTEEYPPGSGWGGEGGTGYPGWSNWSSGDGRDIWETWLGRRGDVARAQFYMDVRYEAGDDNAPDLVLTNDLGKIETTGEGAERGYMGLLNDLIRWHYEDPVDDVERARHEIVFFYQKNRNPFVDHPEWVRDVFEVIFEDGFESGNVSAWSSSVAGSRSPGR